MRLLIKVYEVLMLLLNETQVKCSQALYNKCSCSSLVHLKKAILYF
jgi:hypothetical protein